MNIALSHIITFSRLILASQNENLQLTPIQEPAPIPFSFETIGWKILLIFILLLLIFSTFKWIQHYKKNAYRRIAIKHLLTIKNESDTSINESAILLKSIAITAYGRKEVAALYGNEWLQFLESTGKNTLFTKYADSLLAIQNSNQNIDVTTQKEILSLTKKWIQTHA